jgi:putative ABC transport system permease protein
MRTMAGNPMLWNAILLALREIKRKVLRSFLTILGIVIGVSAVITMVTIGGGATVQARQQIASPSEHISYLTNFTASGIEFSGKIL